MPSASRPVRARWTVAWASLRMRASSAESTKGIRLRKWISCWSESAQLGLHSFAVSHLCISCSRQLPTIPLRMRRTSHFMPCKPLCRSRFCRVGQMLMSGSAAVQRPGVRQFRTRELETCDCCWEQGRLANSCACLERNFTEGREQRWSLPSVLTLEDRPGTPMRVQLRSLGGSRGRGCRRHRAGVVPCYRHLPGPNRQRPTRSSLGVEWPHRRKP